MQDDYFKNKMKGVKPLKKNTIVKKNEIKLNKNITKILNNDQEEKKKQNSIKQKTTKEASNFSLAFNNINKDLKKGRIKIDRRIDLHGFSLLDAQEKFTNEVIKMYNSNKRCILVITGKGAHNHNQDKGHFDDEKPKLFYGKIKNSIISWIKNETLKKYILTYQNAGIDYGGDGAIFIYLRKKKF